MSYALSSSLPSSIGNDFLEAGIAGSLLMLAWYMGNGSYDAIIASCLAQSLAAVVTSSKLGAVPFSCLMYYRQCKVQHIVLDCLSELE